MTVAELLRELEQLPPELQVFVPGRHSESFQLAAFVNLLEFKPRRTDFIRVAPMSAGARVGRRAFCFRRVCRMTRAEAETVARILAGDSDALCGVDRVTHARALLYEFVRAFPRFRDVADAEYRRTFALGGLFDPPAFPRARE